jgi:ligand-binding sensor domain-containing protein/AraC-like DNA-binding protein
MKIARIVSVFLILFLSIFSIALETVTAGNHRISHELNTHLVRSIVQTEDGYIWILAGQGVLRFDGREFENMSIEADHYAYKLLSSKRRLRELTQKNLTDYGLSSDQIQAVIEDRKGILWVGTKIGLDRLYKAPNGCIQTENYLKNEDVLSLLEDKEGNIWIGTRSTGLKCLRETAFTAHSVSDSSASNHFTALLKDSKGRIWAGTRYGDLYWYEDGHFERAPLETDIFDNFMFIIEENNRGDILFGTEYRGVHVYENGKTRSYMAEDGPVSGTIVTLYSDSLNRLWVGRYGKELGFYKNSRYTRFLTSEEYPGKMVFSILEDKQHNLWIGGARGVLFLPDGNTDKLNMKWFLHDIHIHSLLEDDSGMIWCGTSENGLIRIHPDSFATARITDNEGLWNNSIYLVLQDNWRYLWLTTYQRIMRVPLDELNSLADKKREKINPVIFGLSDGLPSPGLAGLRMQEGHLLFATNNGIAEVDPEAIPVNDVPPGVLVHRILQNGRILEMGEETAGPLKIKSRSHLEIHLKVITFKGQENIQAKYRLTGLEDSWTSIAPEQDKIVTFTDLTPGQYTLQIMASNNHGIWNEEGALISFQVVPGFSQTIYFKLLLLFVVIAAIALVVLQMNNRAQIKKNKYRKTRLPENLAQQYQQRLLFLLEKEKIYRDSSLCLKTLSRQMSLPSHHLSQVINEKFQKNFYELINGYRIEESKEMLISESKETPKILAIAYDVGFNNLSSFNRAFKRYTGKTPTEFKNGCQNRTAH